MAYEEIHKLSQSVENSPTIVIITDKDSAIEYVNPVFTEITDYTEEDVIGVQLNTFIASELSRKTVENAWYYAPLVGRLSDGANPGCLLFVCL